MNEEQGSAIDSRLADWRERGEDRLAPLRFHFIEALSRRASHQRGEARRMLDKRLSRHLQAYEDEVVEPARRLALGKGTDQEQPGDDTAARPLAELLAYAARMALNETSGNSTSDETAQHDALRLAPALIDYFRDAWAKASTTGLLRRSREQVPDKAGPLNSSSLAHRTLMLMREQSPAYLHHFLSYMDALSWMEQMNDERIRVSAKPAAAGGRKAAKRQA